MHRDTYHTHPNPKHASGCSRITCTYTVDISMYTSPTSDVYVYIRPPSRPSAFVRPPAFVSPYATLTLSCVILTSLSL